MVACPSILKYSGSETNSFQHLPRCTHVAGRCFPPSQLRPRRESAPAAGQVAPGSRRPRPCPGGGRASPPAGFAQCLPTARFHFLFCFVFFFFEATPLEYDRLGFLALPDCFLCVCWVFCFFSLFCGCPKKVCILSRFLNPFSTREITGKDVESFLLVLCVKGGLVNPELFFILKKKVK